MAELTAMTYDELRVGTTASFSKTLGERDIESSIDSFLRQLYHRTRKFGNLTRQLLVGCIAFTTPPRHFKSGN